MEKDGKWNLLHFPLCHVEPVSGEQALRKGIAMNQVLFMLKTIPEYAALVQGLNQG